MKAPRFNIFEAPDPQELRDRLGNMNGVDTEALSEFCMVLCNIIDRQRSQIEQHRLQIGNLVDRVNALAGSLQILFDERV